MTQVTKNNSTKFLGKERLEKRGDIHIKHDVYIASPFFKPDQIERVQLVEDLLDRLGITYFSPRKVLVCPPDATEEQRKKTFKGNHDGILQSRAVIAITDGKDVGTIWEMGVAYQAGVPVIGVALTLGDKPFNLMLSESCYSTCRTIEELEKTLTDGSEIYYEGKIE